MQTNKTVKTISYCIDTIKPDTATVMLNELKLFLAATENKHVDMIHSYGTGSKYLAIYTSPPDLIIRVSDHPTGSENAVTVNSKPKLFAAAYEEYRKVKKGKK